MLKLHEVVIIFSSSPASQKNYTFTECHFSGSKMKRFVALNREMEKWVYNQLRVAEKYMKILLKRKSLFGSYRLSNTVM